MVTIFCVVAGPGSVFAVDIGITQTIDHLKKQIKEENPNMMRFDAPLLKLYLARDGGAWLNSNDDDIKALKRREVPDRIKNLMQEQLMLVETRKLNHDDYFGKNFRPAEEDIHVLVELPEDPKEVLHYKTQNEDELECDDDEPTEEELDCDDEEPENEELDCDSDDKEHGHTKGGANEDGEVGHDFDSVAQHEVRAAEPAPTTPTPTPTTAAPVAATPAPTPTEAAKKSDTRCGVLKD